MKDIFEDGDYGRMAQEIHVVVDERDKGIWYIVLNFKFEISLVLWV